MSRIYIGAAYYPELWDEREVDHDIERCKDLGIDVLRIGEFAWSRMEPREGEFDFEWLKTVVEKLYANGISTVMCTPTCTPPRYMLDKYETIRAVNTDGRRVNVSSRCHVCKTSELAREKNRIIVTEMAKAFAKHPGVIGWQIDNELYPYGGGCYCETCKAAFREYLKEKFGTVENLNSAWGMARWSLDYESFDAVRPPYPDEWRHPSLEKAWWDFQCRQIKSFADEQAEVLHKYGCKNVGTDMMATNRLGYYDVNEKLDVVQFNHYNTADELPYTAFAYDFLRCVKNKPFWVTETQVGWNGSTVSECGYRPIGNCYANTWLPVSKGAEMNMYWLFRAHPSGHELAHGALYSAAGRSYRVTEEVEKACADIKKCESFLTDSRVKSNIALHYSTTAANIFAAASMLKNFDYRQTVIEKYHAAFRHYNIDVIDTPHALDGYKVVISPFLACADEHDFKKRITDYVKNGGTWIVGPMSDITDCNLKQYTAAPYGFLEELCGVYTKYRKPIDNDVFKAVWRDGEPLEISKCFDAYEIDSDVNVTSLARYDGGEFDGLSVITQTKVGEGRVILVGSVISKSDLMRLVNLPPIAEASGNVVLTERVDKNGKTCGIIAVETENKKGYIVSDSGCDLISGRTLSGKIEIEPHGVTVVKK